MGAVGVGVGRGAAVRGGSDVVVRRADRAVPGGRRTPPAETAKELAADAGLSAATVVGETGDPVDAIARAAEEHDVDVIVVGAGEKNWWHRLFEGSVSKDIIRVANRPCSSCPSHRHAGHDTAPAPEH